MTATQTGGQMQYEFGPNGNKTGNTSAIKDPCPFCGAPPDEHRFRGIYNHREDTVDHAVECGNCGAQGPHRRTREAAARGWGRRVNWGQTPEVSDG